MTAHRSRSPFQILGSCLRGALGQTLDRSDLPSNPEEWEIVLRLSSAHLATPQLRWALREQHLFSDLPVDVAEYLDAVYTLNLDKNRRCEEQLAHFIGILNSVGVHPVLLKGAAAIVGGLYPTPGERMISDLDILIPAGKLPEVLEKLASEGYQPVLANGAELPNPVGFETEDHHYAPVMSPEWPAPIELHVHPVHLPFDKILSSEEVFAGGTKVHWRGVDLLLPSPMHFVIHNVIHAFIVDVQMALHRLSIRQLFEFALVSQKYGELIDWRAVSGRFGKLGYGKSLQQYVALANACLNFKVPSEVDISGLHRFQVAPYLIRQDLDSPAVEWTINFLSQINGRMSKLRRSPWRIRRLLKADFYSNLFNSIKS